ncbi:hypothetical protein BC938DRAFT_478558 [Jimgerdemannia flammicorona]|uniref:F-box domain-containing protein n=1 Tax=Jimgerdemannia flammicorona TaxID=994334 RepID=A0A433QMP6_9FUNG|nr:hypothetical protein BC938DRAFT_478558 [Jimgerdemannia flammicorona]
MPYLPPEILSQIFRLLKETAQNPDLDLLAASLVCTHWCAEAWPLVPPDLFPDRSLLLKDSSGKDAIRRTSLLALCLRYELIQCDHLESIEIHHELDYIRDRDNLRAMAAAIHQVVRVQSPGLRRIKIHPQNYNPCYLRPAEMIELLDVIFPPGEVAMLTELTIDRGSEITAHLIERVGPTLRDIFLRGFQFDALLLEALGRCRNLECLSASDGWLPGPGARPAPPGAVAILAAALPNLTTLRISINNWEGGPRVSNEQLREIVTRLPDLKHLAVGVDLTLACLPRAAIFPIGERGDNHGIVDHLASVEANITKS